MTYIDVGHSEKWKVLNLVGCLVGLCSHLSIFFLHKPMTPISMDAAELAILKKSKSQKTEKRMRAEQIDYVMMAMDHWRKFLPKMWKSLKADGREIAAIHEAATKAHNQVSDLIRQGLREDEAEEIVLPELILLPPEIKTTGSRELDLEMKARGMEI